MRKQTQTRSERKWRSLFRDFVATNFYVGICDRSGEDVIFGVDRKPKWNELETVYRSGPFMRVVIRRKGCSCKNDEKSAAKWLREFAAEYGVFHVSIDVDRIGDDERGYTVELDMSFDYDRPPLPERYDDADSFWIVGDLDRYVFLGSKGDDFDGCYVEVSDPDAAVKFESREEAAFALWNDADLIEWVDRQGGPDAVRPLFVDVKTSVRAI